MRDVRCFTAFLFAPLVVPLAFMFWVASLTNGPPPTLVPFLLLVSVVAGYLGTLILGLPLYLIMRSAGMTSIVYAPVFGSQRSG